MTERTVHTRWTGGMRAVTEMDGFEIVVDEPEAHGGSGAGPQPTDLLLTSVASCIALSMAFVARRRGVELRGLQVTVTGTYKGLQFERIAVSIGSGTPREVLEGLVPEAERVCYVSNTLRHRPELVIRLD
jgi:putative redox protein